ncbi:hypothetical protein CGA22_23220 [Pseudomonas sp. PSB18]|nr:hypothetical protein [Pseudomonas sp. PSB18]
MLAIKTPRFLTDRINLIAGKPCSHSKLYFSEPALIGKSRCDNQACRNLTHGFTIDAPDQE